jgi:hypothetical protein
MPSRGREISLLHYLGNLPQHAGSLVAETAFVQLVDKCDSRRELSGHHVAMSLLQHSHGVLLAYPADRFELTSELVRLLQIVPTGRRIAAGESGTGPFHNLHGDILCQLLRWQKVA